MCCAILANGLRRDGELKRSVIAIDSAYLIEVLRSFRWCSMISRILIAMLEAMRIMMGCVRRLTKRNPPIIDRNSEISVLEASSSFLRFPVVSSTISILESSISFWRWEMMIDPSV